jgi:hypothetical protein
MKSYEKMAELDENRDDILLLNMYPLYPPDSPEFSRCLDPELGVSWGNSGGRRSGPAVASYP